MSIFYILIEIIKEKGVDKITVDELVKDITSKGRGKNASNYILSVLFILS